MKTIAIIGGGAAGMMAGISALENEDTKVLLFERNEKLGKKLYITGKGRCNLTNLSDVSDIMANVSANPYFLFSCLSRMDAFALVDFFNKNGLATKVERGARVFPGSDRSSDVIRVLKSLLEHKRAEIHLNTRIAKIETQKSAVKGVLTRDKRFFGADAVIIATGGLSYPKTGSTGDGYKLASGLGHKITKCYPSLVGLTTDDAGLTSLQGLTLKNTGVRVSDENGKTIFAAMGEVLFTHNGISGPVILTASRFITKQLYDKKDPGEGSRLNLRLDLKPALSEAKLDDRILRDFAENKNKNFNNSLSGLLPEKLIDIIIEKSGIGPYEKVNEITGAKRHRLLTLLKGFPIAITGTEGFERAVITCGGVDVNEINPSTMESKLVKGLYFAGEVIDVDAFTGGYNLQIAFSTGYLAGKTEERL